MFLDTILPGGGTRFSIERAVTVFPQPDSPTRPSTRPFWSMRLRFSTALMTPDRVKKCVVRFCISRRFNDAAPITDFEVLQNSDRSSLQRYPDQTEALPSTLLRPGRRT